MKKIHILFFGKLKEIWSTSSIDTQTHCNTLEELYQELIESAKETPIKSSIKVAINDEFSEWGAMINDGDTIAFLPPASGG